MEFNSGFKGLTTVQEAGVDQGFVKSEAYSIYGAFFKKE